VPEKARLPFSVKPKEPMTLEHFTRVLRDHYETTPYYQAAAGYAEGTPHKGHASTVCCPATNSSSVFQLRPDLPLAIGAVWWNALWQPCSSPYLPIYLGMDRVPGQLAFPEKKDHHWGSPAYTLFGELARWVDEDYGKRIVSVRARWASLEKAAREFQPVLEKMMLNHPDAMDQALGIYCQGLAARAMQEAQALMAN
jgi:dipeptidase